MKHSFVQQISHQVSLNTLQKWDNSILDAFLLNDHMPIIIASSGRAGSTMLFHSVLMAQYRLKISRKYAQRPLFRKHQLCNVKSGRVYKTHLLYEKLKNINARVIYVYDDYSSTLSSFFGCIDRYGEAWGLQHMKNLESRFTSLEGLGEADILNYEKQIKQYVLDNRVSKEQLVAIPYEYLWKIDLMKVFGFTVTLPTKRARQSTNRFSLSNNHIDLMNRYYKDAVEKFIFDWGL